MSMPEKVDVWIDFRVLLVALRNQYLETMVMESAAVKLTYISLMVRRHPKASYYSQLSL